MLLILLIWFLIKVFVSAKDIFLDLKRFLHLCIDWMYLYKIKNSVVLVKFLIFAIIFIIFCL